MRHLHFILDPKFVQNFDFSIVDKISEFLFYQNFYVYTRHKSTKQAQYESKQAVDLKRKWETKTRESKGDLAGNANEKEDPERFVSIWIVELSVPSIQISIGKTKQTLIIEQYYRWKKEEEKKEAKPGRFQVNWPVYLP